MIEEIPSSSHGRSISNATGIRDMVGPMALAAIAAGADGLMVEVHQ